MRTREHALTISDVFLPSATLMRDIALVLSFGLLTTLTAYIAIPVPFSPVPITAQTLAVLVAGAVLGSRRGAMSQLVYIGQGLIGIPVFAGGGFGPGYVMGPTGGYLFGFVAAAFVVGWLAERRWDRSPVTMACAMIAGGVAIYACGALWLSVFVQGNLTAAFTMGVLPFVPGDLIKIVIGTAAFPALWAFLRK